MIEEKFCKIIKNLLMNFIIKERELYEKPTKEKIDDAEFFKAEGNKAYKEGDHQKSSYFYQKVLYFLLLQV